VVVVLVVMEAPVALLLVAVAQERIVLPQDLVFPKQVTQLQLVVVGE
tara:strand:- start:1056 stop:1196 length:141 start_codon:yes stop_codon:yes gene_type:complete